jgi:hypothetical protein
LNIEIGPEILMWYFLQTSKAAAPDNHQLSIID